MQKAAQKVDTFAAAARFLQWTPQPAVAGIIRLRHGVEAAG